MELHIENLEENVSQDADRSNDIQIKRPLKPNLIEEEEATIDA